MLGLAAAPVVCRRVAGPHSSPYIAGLNQSRHTTISSTPVHLPSPGAVLLLGVAGAGAAAAAAAAGGPPTPAATASQASSSSSINRMLCTGQESTKGIGFRRWGGVLDGGRGGDTGRPIGCDQLEHHLLSFSVSPPRSVKLIIGPRPGASLTQGVVKCKHNDLELKALRTRAAHR